MLENKRKRVFEARNDEVYKISLGMENFIKEKEVSSMENVAMACQRR